MTAPVSGPGALSRRTDTGPAQKIRDLPDAQYGEAATYRDLQQQAPLAQTPPAATPRPSPKGAAASGPPPLTSLSAPTARPDEPVTAGADAGAGPGASALGLPDAAAGQYQSAADALRVAAQMSQNPDLLWLAKRATEGRF